MKTPTLTALALGACLLAPAAMAQSPSPLVDTTHTMPPQRAEDPFAAQARRKAALKTGDKAAIAKASAEENAAFAKWRREHPRAAAVTPASKAASEANARERDKDSPFQEQAERKAALKSGDKAAIARATADEDAAFAQWRRDHPAAAAVTPQMKAAHQRELARIRARHHHHPA